MLKFSRRAKIFSVFIVVVVGGFFVSRLIGGSGEIPSSFTQARLQGALISQDIVNLSNKAVSELEIINKLEEEGNFDEALGLVSQVINESHEIRDKAVELSSEIEKMIRALSDIKSFEARQAALESITDRLALISRLINYSAGLSQLLETLTDKFTGASAEYNIPGLVEQINAEVRAINNFNNQAVEAMERFDDIVR